MKSRCWVFYILLMAVMGCNRPQRMVYYIPQDYEGWVNIVYRDGNAPHKVIRPTSNSELCFVTNPPSWFVVSDNMWTASDKAIIGAEISRDYFYYSLKDTVKLLPGQVHFESVSGWTPGDTRKGTYSFYVTRKAITNEEQTKYKFPENVARAFPGLVY